MMCDSALVTLWVRGDARNSSSRCLGLSMNHRASVFPMRGQFPIPTPSSTVLYQQLVLTEGLWKKINEMHALVLIPNVGVMAIDCAYVLGGLFCCLPQTEHTCLTYLFALFPLEILEDTEHDGREPNLLVGWAPLSVGWYVQWNVQTLISTSRAGDWSVMEIVCPPSSGQWNQTAHGRRCFSIQQIKERICFDFPGQNFPSPMLLHNMLHWAQRIFARMLYGHITINFLIIRNFHLILFFFKKLLAVTAEEREHLIWKGVLQ